MLIRNTDISNGLVNGARGVVVDFEPWPESNAGVVPIVEFVNPKSAKDKSSNSNRIRRAIDYVRFQVCDSDSK